MSTKDTRSYEKTLEIVKSLPKENNKVIFCRNTKAADDLKEGLEQLGYTVFILNGVATKTDKKKEDTRQLFNQTNGGIIITNDEKGTNLGSAKHMIVYGYPDSMPQLIPRIIRGFSDVSITIDVLHYYCFEEVTLYKVFGDIDLVERKTKRHYPWKQPLIDDIKFWYPDFKI